MLVLEDVLSRYQWLCILQTKEANGVALECLKIFKGIGAPNVLQSDRSGKFLKKVIPLCDKQGIDMRGKADHVNRVAREG